jgi:methylated-DNA-protein-cysteine methyltransferase-like protein
VPEKDFTFFEDVYAIVRLIPEGRVTTYGAIAACLGSRGASRMVGWAMNRSHGMSPPVPAHRVVNRNGLLTGKMMFDGPDAMRKLLEAEGVNVTDDKVTDFQKIFWDPCIEIGI